MKVYLVTMDYPGKNIILGTFTKKEKAEKFFNLKRRGDMKEFIDLLELESNDDDKLMQETKLFVYEDASYEIVFQDYILSSEPKDPEIDFFHKQEEINLDEETGMYAIACVDLLSRSVNLKSNLNFDKIVEMWEEDGSWLCEDGENDE